MSAPESRKPTVTRTLEPGLTFFSAAEIDVVLVPVGNISPALFDHYVTLVMQHRQVELMNVRSFYRAAQKSPFNHFPWRTGTMNFRFLPEDVAFRSRPLGCLHASRNVQAAIGIIACSEEEGDLIALYDEFEKKIQSMSDTKIMRTLAFDPTDAQTLHDVKARPDLVLFPPGQGSHLLSHMEVVMHDFAACMLDDLEQRMLTVSPQNVSLTSYIDSRDFLGPALSSVAFASEDESQRTKRKYARVQKAMGDYALLSGSPLDAAEHYSTAADLARASQDWVYVAAASEGLITAKLLSEAMSRNGFVPSEFSVFHNEDQWRAPMSDLEVLESKRSSLSPREDAEESGNPGTRTTLDTPPNDSGQAAKLSDGSIENDDMDRDDPFSQDHFWQALRSCETLHEEVIKMMDECKSAIRKRGALSLLVESELRYARLLVGLQGKKARKTVCSLVSSIQLAAELLPLPEDRIIALTEAASVLGSVGASRKRVLLLWQAVELSKYFGFPDEKTLAVARHALEPFAHTSDSHDEWSIFKRPLSQDTSIPHSWSSVKAGILEATLGLAIYANRHADVWDAAAALLREHSHELSQHRIRSLYDNMKTASSNMAVKDKFRPGKGPPPVLYLLGPRMLEGDASLHLFDSSVLKKAITSPITSPTASQTPFLYDAFAVKRQERKQNSAGKSPNVVDWICGEPGIVEVEIANPCPMTMRIARLTLEANCNGVPATKDQWKPKVVSLSVPPGVKPSQVSLEGTPLVEGDFILTGCRMTSLEGVSWCAPWSIKPLDTWQCLGEDCRMACKEVCNLPFSNRFRALMPQPKATLSFREEIPHFDAHNNDDGGTSGDSTLRLTLLQGQRTQGILTFENCGTVPIDYASLNVVCADEDLSKASKISIEMIEPNILSENLPVQPGTSIDVPIQFSTEILPSLVGQMLSNDDILHHFIIEYASESSERVENSNKVVGRRTWCDLSVRVKPSIGFTELGIEEVWCRAHHSSDWTLRCLMLVGVVNRGKETMKISLEINEGSGADFETSDLAGQTVEVNPEERGVVPLFVPNLSHVDLECLVENEIIENFDGRHMSAAEYERQLSAAWLSSSVTMKFTGDGVIGQLPLARGELYHALMPQIVSHVRKHGVQGRVLVEGEKVERKNATCVSGEVSFSESGIPIVCAKMGESLTVTISLKNSQYSSIHARYSIDSCPVSFSPVLMENGAPTAIVASCQASKSNPMDLGIAWSGVTRNVTADVHENSSHDQRLNAVFCSPGLYMITLSNTSVQLTDEEHHSSFMHATPVFVHISDS